MNLIHTILAFLFAIVVLIVFHELGHYVVARLCNVKVLRFSLGMGKILFSRRLGKDQTEWVISALPLGGYVKMLDLRENEGEPIPLDDLAREFTGQSVWKRISIVAAGPLANLLLAVVLFAVLFMVGVPEPIAKLRAPGVTTQAYQAGIRGDERIVEVNGKPIQLWSELRWELLQPAIDKAPVTLSVISPPATQPHAITLRLDRLSTEDLQQDFLHTLGLNLALSHAKLGHINPNGPAMRAGLQAGDIVQEIDGKKIVDSIDLIETVRASPNKRLHFIVDRAGVQRDFFVTPDAVVVDGKRVGKLNVEVRSVPDMVNHQDGLVAATQKAVMRTWETSVLIVKTLAKMVVGQVSLKNITGPLTIADYAGQTAQIGWISYVSFLAFISISLGVMNLLPIPILDGGHLLYYSLEVLTGRPMSERFLEVAQRVGMALLVLLMAVAFFNDIVRLFPF